MPGDQVPPGCPRCLYWRKPVSKRSVSVWSHCCGAEVVRGKVTGPKWYESLWQRTNLNQGCHTFLLWLHQCLYLGAADWNSSLAENLCPNMSLFGFTATENCLLESPTWQVYTKSSYDFDLLPLSLLHQPVPSAYHILTLTPWFTKPILHLLSREVYKHLLLAGD